MPCCNPPPLTSMPTPISTPHCPPIHHTRTRTDLIRTAAFTFPHLLTATFPQAEEAAGGVFSLCIPEASYITGHTLEVTGGAGI